MNIGMLVCLSIGPDQFASSGKRECGLADAAPTGEQPCMMHSVPGHGLVPFAPSRIMAKQGHAVTSNRCEMAATTC